MADLAYEALAQLAARAAIQLRHTRPVVWLFLLSIAVQPFGGAANAASVKCDKPQALGATVDVAARCAFFARYEPDDKKSDDRVVRNLKLKPGELARSIAVVVGIGKYQNPAYDVPAAGVDVAKLKSFLIDDQNFDEVIVLENEHATFENIRYFLRKYAMDRASYFQGKVRFLFAYSGHGVQMQFFGDDEQPASRNPSVGLALAATARDDDYQNLYGLNELRALFNDLAKNTYHFLALINACYGGDVFGFQMAGGSEFELDSRGAYAITAGPRDKVVYSAKDGQGSLFFQMIIDGVKSGDADHEAQSATLGKEGSIEAYSGVVRLGALDGYLSATMIKYIDSGIASKDWEGNKHHWVGPVGPSDVRAEGGFFFFQHPPATGAATTTSFQANLSVGNEFAPSTNQLSVKDPLPTTDGFEQLRVLGAPVRGIDVSHFAGKIDWPTVAAQNIKFAYIKATQAAKLVDGNFTANWQGAKDAGIKRGAYHTFSFCVEIADQFASLQNIVPEDPSALPIAIDIELYPGQEKSNFGGLAPEAKCAQAIGNEAIRANVGAFADLIEKTYHQKPIIYGNDYVLDKVLTPSVTGRLGVWRVKYGLATKAPPSPWTIWQYSENEKMAGIPGAFDLNVPAAAIDRSMRDPHDVNFNSLVQLKLPDTPVRLRCAQATPDTLYPDGPRGAAPRVARQGEAWWGKKDSNLRSHKTADLQSAPFATRDTPPLNSIAAYSPKWRRYGFG